ncbi:hypothetical protein PV05_08639 [Exophiala xenobiotica]|uniref:JmjC domain-containing protein n=1 Tax=Exophiala xenobiotica TaxID=348802 RepID=A0A0D2CSR6_9EURO|nr:uncharacterized protein PV05_08639 [Exophiala xenobiotica]KIW53037.1 hypothetical protein PV05_08639 [Exophiala xenobiotica]
MQCLATRGKSIKAPRICLNRQLFISTSRRFTTPSRPFHLQVPLLSSWNPDEFETEAFVPASPARLPRSAAHLPPACSKWFIHDHSIDYDLITTGCDKLSIPQSSELRTSFWSDHESTIVPLELTSKGPDGEEIFRRVEAPLKVLLAHLSRPQRAPSEHSIYLAQCDLTSLPESITHDIPSPRLVTRSSSGRIKGDVYASSLWLGRPPTYTPLHRDPNPNVFIQLAGRKVLRLLPPEVGAAIYDDVQKELSHDHGSATIRGEEMMAGPEKLALHAAIWPDDHTTSRYAQVLSTYGLETEVSLGDALFIPRGWWHSVKGVGEGITASVNWWFR